MQVTATDAAVAVVRRAKGARPGVLTITIGTGCCESTAPFLYEDFLPGPDLEPVGSVDDVVVFAPEFLRAMYPGSDGVVVDVYDGPAESMSIETEWGCRLVLRGLGVDTGSGTGAEVGSTGGEACAVATPAPAGASARASDVGQRVKGELPEALRRLRLR